MREMLSTIAILCTAAVILGTNNAVAVNTNCFVCDWVDGSPGEPIKQVEKKCREAGGRTSCQNGEICRTTLKCRTDSDPVVFKLKKECVPNTPSKCQLVNTVGWLEVTSQTPVNLLARSCCAYDKCNKFAGEALFTVFRGQTHEELRFCDNGDVPPGCYEMYFPCKNGNFRPYDYLCDGWEDCGDGSDEDPDICPLPLGACANVYFQCRDSPSLRCIRNTWVCDGWFDCPNGEDENAANCPRPLGACNCGEFQCSQSPQRQCIPDYFRCYGRARCESGEDADASSCPRPLGSCPPGEFQCVSHPNRTCIRDEYVCDGKRDCPEPEDEANDLCPRPKGICPHGEFQCAQSGACVLGKDHCDGDIDDCPFDDYSDERDCPK